MKADLGTDTACLHAGSAPHLQGIWRQTPEVLHDLVHCGLMICDRKYVERFLVEATNFTVLVVHAISNAREALKLADIDRKVSHGPG